MGDWKFFIKTYFKNVNITSLKSKDQLTPFCHTHKTNIIIINK